MHFLGLFFIFSLGLRNLEAHLEFITNNGLHGGKTLPLPKQKTGLAVDKLGEDSFFLTEDSVIVCDGVGGNEFPAYIAAELMAIAATDYHFMFSKFENELRKAPHLFESSDVQTNPDFLIASFATKGLAAYQQGLEFTLNAYIYAYQKFFTAYLSAFYDNSQIKSGSLRKVFREAREFYMNQSLNDPAFFEQVDSLNFLNLNQIFSIPLETKNLNLVQSLSTTLVSASVRSVEGQDRLVIYQYGDSLLNVLRLFRKENKIYYLPVFSLVEFQHSDSFLRQISTNIRINENYEKQLGFDFEDFFSTQRNKELEENIDKVFQKINSIQVQETDIVIAGSDGVYDNLPVSILVYLANFAIKFISEFMGDDLKTSLFDQLNPILTNYFEFLGNPEVTNKDSFAKLKTLVYLQRFKPIKEPETQELDINDFDRKTKSFNNPFSRCSAYQVFFQKWIKDPSALNIETKSVLSRCMRTVISKEVSFDYKLATAVLAEPSNNALIAAFIALAVKVFTMVDLFSRIYFFNGALRTKIAENLKEIMVFENRLFSLDCGKKQIPNDFSMFKHEPQEQEDVEIIYLNKPFHKLSCNQLKQLFKNRITAWEVHIQQLSISIEKAWFDDLGIDAESFELNDSDKLHIQLAKKIIRNIGLGFEQFEDTKTALKWYTRAPVNFLSVLNIRSSILKNASYFTDFGSKPDDITAVFAPLKEKTQTDTLPENKELLKRFRAWTSLFTETLDQWLPKKHETLKI